LASCGFLVAKVERLGANRGAVMVAATDASMFHVAFVAHVLGRKPIFIDAVESVQR
jgi:hypothetical protein